MFMTLALGFVNSERRFHLFEGAQEEGRGEGHQSKLPKSRFS